eukprot:CAMPEP_0114507134 /NCGR_PEP_ID=MMETSP0109-20121206/11841_1 /TAXON_ID=29199 /ORGANISM="Chlorarachnion reptans, Strain CCCM449" /LENGTH=769 /DNA_ID=CAMNT_0001685853 /DNA_START=537 /DNA_END=2845 /DNA_ORIENTATION=-
MEAPVELTGGGQGDVMAWLNNTLQEPREPSKQQDDDDSGDDEFDSARWLMANINEESNDIPVGATHISDEEWKTVSVEIVASSRPPVSKSGWLQKRGKTNNSYKRRFCEVRGHNFYYYHSEKVDGQGEEKKGEISLLNADIHAEREGKGDRMVRKRDFLHYVDAEAARQQAVWIDNEDVRRCMNQTCQRKFNMAWRRHHCRYCGRIFCNECITTGKGRKLKGQPAKVDKQGYYGVKICMECVKLPETRMTRPMYPGSTKEKRNTLPSEKTLIQTSAGAIKSSKSMHNRSLESTDASRFNSAPVKSQEKPAQLPASFLDELAKPPAAVKIDDLLESPTLDEDTPARLPDAWMAGLSNQELPAMADDSTQPAVKERANSLDTPEKKADKSLYEERKANSLRRRKNRQSRQTFTTNIRVKLKKKESKKKEEENNKDADDEETEKKPPEFDDENNPEESKSASNEWDTVVFSIKPADLTRRYYFQVESPNVCQEWVRILQIHSRQVCKSILRKPGKDSKEEMKQKKKTPIEESSTEENKPPRTVRFSRKIDYHDSDSKGPGADLKNKDGWIRTGYLAKVGMRFTTWKVRYFALRRHMLTYFKISGSSRQQRGTIWLRGAEVSKRASVKMGFHRANESELKSDSLDSPGPEVHALSSAVKGSFHSRNPTKHILAGMRITDEPSKPSPNHLDNKFGRESIHSRQISSDSLEPNVRKEKTRYVHEFMIKTRQQPKSKYGDDVHVSKLKPGRVYYVRAASKRDRNWWMKAIQEAAQG